MDTARLSLKEGVHSGNASGVVLSSFRILRELLSRLEDSATGQIKPKELYVDIPPQRIEQAKLWAVLRTASVTSAPAAGGRPYVGCWCTSTVMCDKPLRRCNTEW